MKKITFCGNMIVDSNKLIDIYPSLGMLSKIKTESYSVGGSACNTSIDLKAIDSNINVSVIGKIGDDDKGKFILNEYKKYNIDISKVIIDKEHATSYTDCMVDAQGRRTFFQYGGANDYFGLEDININNLDCDILHIGYLLLLPQFDAKNDKYGTNLAEFLSKVRQRNIKTSIDVVSEEGDRFQNVVIPSLKYCDYVVINEIESGKITGIAPRDENGILIKDNLKLIIEKLFELGVQDTVIIHSPEMGIIKRKGKDIKLIPSFAVDKSRIVSSVGAGDAFLAGSLYGLLNNLADEEIVKIGHASAIFNLYAKDSISGATNVYEIKKLIKTGKENIL